MKILCAIDNLGSGGAQRQIVSLAGFLKERGHDVSILSYHPANFFASELERHHIPVTCISAVPKLARPWAFRRTFKQVEPDAVLAFLEGPSLYSEIAGLPSRKWGLVVSERIQINNNRRDLKRALHHLADYVTTNSHANRRAMERLYPRLASRIVTVFNCLDLSAFSLAETVSSSKAVRFVVAATVQPRKNTHGFIRAAGLLKSAQPNLKFRIDWYGESAADPSYIRAAKDLITSAGLGQSFFLHPPSQDMPGVYASADAVVLPSLLEGLPNTVCEAMACGKPVLASRIGDAEILIRNGENGLLFDPNNVEDVALALGKFCNLAPGSRAAMGATSRLRAERLFDPGPIVSKYESLLAAASNRRLVPVSHCPPEAEIDDSALRPAASS